MKLTNIVTIVVFMLILLGFQSKASAVCLTASLSGVPASVTFNGNGTGYDVFDSGEHMQSFSFQVNASTVSLPCTYFVTLSAGQSANFSSRRMSLGANNLNYNAYVNSSKTNILKALPTATSSETISGSFPLGLSQSQTVTIYWTATPLQIVPYSASLYSDDSLTISLYTGILNISELLVDTKTINFRAQVNSSVDVSLTDSGSSFNLSDTTQTLDFNDLSNGESLGFDTVIRSNSGYQVTLQSQNSNKLLHQNSPTVSSNISYILNFNSSNIDLSSGLPVNVATGTGVTTAQGLSFPTQVTIGSVTGKTSGTYSDVISVSVSAN